MNDYTLFLLPSHHHISNMSLSSQYTVRHNASLDWRLYLSFDGLCNYTKNN